MRALLVVLISVVIAMLADQPARSETRMALVVANSEYAAAPLANPSLDADLVASALEKMGFKVTVKKEADLAAFDTALGDFEAEARGADIAVFYFAGHGFAVNDGLEARNYLMSTSADVTSTSERVIRAGGVALDEIIASITEAQRSRSSSSMRAATTRACAPVAAPGGGSRGSPVRIAQASSSGCRRV